MSDPPNEGFLRLVSSLALQDIRPMEMHSKRFGDPPPQGVEVQLEWKQILANGDPLIVGPDGRVFRPKYEFSVEYDTNNIFQQTSIFILAFKVTDRGALDELWLDESLRKVFMEKQLQRTMWPIFRQHVLDGMSRLGLQAIPLPWLI